MLQTALQHRWVVDLYIIYIDCQGNYKGLMNLGIMKKDQENGQVGSHEHGSATQLVSSGGKQLVLHPRVSFFFSAPQAMTCKSEHCLIWCKRERKESLKSNWKFWCFGQPCNHRRRFILSEPIWGVKIMWVPILRLSSFHNKWVFRVPWFGDVCAQKWYVHKCTGVFSLHSKRKTVSGNCE